MTNATASFDDIVNYFQGECQRIQTARANPRTVENIPVEAYGTTMTVQELASISTPEAQLLIIQPWDSSVLKSLETALRQSDLSLAPVVDGAKIRLAFPPLTHEKRQELVKVLHAKFEEARVRLRKVRSELLKEWKEREQRGELSEDDYFREEKELQKQVDACNEKMQKMFDGKEQELLTL